MSHMERLGTKVFLFIIVSGLINFYVISKLFLLFNLPKETGFIILWILCSISYLLGAELLRFFSNSFAKIISLLFSTWFGASFIFLWTFAIYDLVNLFWQMNFQIVGFFVLGLDLLLIAYSIYNASTFNVRTIKVESEKITKPLRFIQLTDLHIGAAHKDNFLKKTISRVNELSPEFVVMTGDLIDGVHKYKGNEFECLNELNMPIYFTLGNHEQFLEEKDVNFLLRNSKLIFLRNNSVERGEIHLIGIDDTPNNNLFKSNLSKINKNSSKFNLLLYHRPSPYKFAAEENIDLMLTGHTHGGQIFPLNWIMQAIDGPVEGIYKRKEMILYVSNGTGWWGPPMRLGSRNEITVIEIIPKDNPDVCVQSSDEKIPTLDSLVDDSLSVNDAQVVSLKRGETALKVDKNELKMFQSKKNESKSSSISQKNKKSQKNNKLKSTKLKTSKKVKRKNKK